MSVDMTTNYLGLKLANPVVVAACPLTGELDVLRKLQDHGAAAAVMPSVFEEQLMQREATGQSQSDYARLERLTSAHALREYNRGPDLYLKHLTAAKQTASIPLIGSLNVTGPSEAVQYARRIEEAGADALELNIYFVVTDAEATSQEIEWRYLDVVSSVRSQISIPLAVKLSAFFTSLPNFAHRAVEAGANGLVLFNRFWQPDIDLKTLQVASRLTLSSPDEVRLSLRWIGLLYGRLKASLAATSGVHFADDVVKLLLVGADAVMVASTLYRHGVECLPKLIDGARYWLESHDYTSVAQIKGQLSQISCPDPAVFERANYTQMLASFLDDGASAG